MIKLSQKRFDTLKDEIYKQAYQKGLVEGEKRMNEKFRAREDIAKDEAHRKALEAVTKLASVLGQTIDAVSKAMQSDRGQL